MEVSNQDFIDLHVELVCILQEYTSKLSELRIKALDASVKETNHEVVLTFSELDRLIEGLSQNGYQDFDQISTKVQKLIKKSYIRIAKNE